ncbi:hypothetical protein [Nocardia sp. NBC_00403]|uniref:hypothetical protein n=1 Tax=Nocardia sp. NBC_00403 TaxID=2975990 RepID=UPI002E1E71DF
MSTPRIRIRKDNTTYSQVRYRVECDGRTVETSQSFDDHGAAIRWAKLLDEVGPLEAERILAAQQGATQSEFVTLTEWLRRYANRLTGIEEATRTRYHRYITPFFDGAYTPVEAVTQDMDAAWVIHLEQEVGNSPKTIHNRHGLLSASMSRFPPVVGFCRMIAHRGRHVSADDRVRRGALDRLLWSQVVGGSGS